MRKFKGISLSRPDLRIMKILLGNKSATPTEIARKTDYTLNSVFSRLEKLYFQNLVEKDTRGKTRPRRLTKYGEEVAWWLCLSKKERRSIYEQHSG